MKFKPLAASVAAFAALTMVGTLPAAAQPASGWAGSQGWDRDAFWRDAPQDPYQRITFLQRRIDRGLQDGSLDRREARRAQSQLNGIRRDADQMRRRHQGRFSSGDYQYIQGQLDQLSQRVRWSRQSAGYGGGYGAPGPQPGNYGTDYDASRYYREGPGYQERRLSDRDEVYRGSDGRYYCKRGDGTTGLIVGAAAGGILGNIIDGGHNRAAGTLIGGALGALAGKSVADNQEIRCR
jgi:hypothetical protein